MTETTVESIFGVNAGIVWEALNENGTSTIADLAKTTSLSREEVHGALGWLGRENKISVKMGEGGRGKRASVFSLNA
jgi:predicted ArsR family transcriptional regulator